MVSFSSCTYHFLFCLGFREGGVTTECMPNSRPSAMFLELVAAWRPLGSPDSLSTNVMRLLFALDRDPGCMYSGC